MLMASRRSPELLRLELVEGRFFDETDATAEENRVIVTQDYARMIFPDRSPIGRLVPNEEAAEEAAYAGREVERPQRIVGVIRPYRGRGEHRPAEPQVLSCIDWETYRSIPPTTLLIRVRPGSPVQLEEDLLKTASAIAPGWTFTLTRMEDMRARLLKGALVPLWILGVVGVFLIVMVGLGLIGVLWQSVIRRTEEIGVRRAMGATANAVRLQFLQSNRRNGRGTGTRNRSPAGAIATAGTGYRRSARRARYRLRQRRRHGHDARSVPAAGRRRVQTHGHHSPVRWRLLRRQQERQLHYQSRKGARRPRVYEHLGKLSSADAGFLAGTD
jgi:hypothetical protein